MNMYRTCENRTPHICNGKCTIFIENGPKKISETYEIDGHNVIISNGTITLKTKSGRQDFVFQNSTPETVAKVANILLEAVKLVR